MNGRAGRILGAAALFAAGAAAAQLWPHAAGWLRAAEGIGLFREARAAGASDQADIRPTYSGPGAILSSIPPKGVWVPPGGRIFVDGVMITWVNVANVPFRCVGVVSKAPEAINREGIRVDELKHLSCWEI